MTLHTKYYILSRGYALDADLQKTGNDENVAFYDSMSEVDTALTTLGTPGVQYTVTSYKEVTE